MNAVLSPVLDSKVSEFSSTQEAEAYTQWLQGEIAQRLSNNSLPIPHDQVMARMDALLATFKQHQPQ